MKNVFSALVLGSAILSIPQFGVAHPWRTKNVDDFQSHHGLPQQKGGSVFGLLSVDSTASGDVSIALAGFPIVKTLLERRSSPHSSTGVFPK